MRHDLTTLSLVLAIAESRSITRAAQREHLALAAASKRLSDLEVRLGVKLFERRARGVEPTEAGRALVRHIRSLHASLHALDSEVMAFSQGIKGHLRIAANAGAIAECLPADLAAFAQAHPQIRISLEDLTSAEVQQAVMDGRVDVGVFAPPLQDSRLQTWTYRDGRIAVITPQEHVLARRVRQTGKGVVFEALLDFDIVGLHIGASVHELMLQRALERGRSLNARLQVRGFDAIAQLVGAGMGVAVLPEAVAQRFAQLFAIAVLPLDEPWAQRTYLIGARGVHEAGSGVQALPMATPPEGLRASMQHLPTVVQRFVEALRHQASLQAKA